MTSLTLPKAVVQRLLAAAETAADTMGDELNRDYGAGNDHHDDVIEMAESLRQLDDAIATTRKFLGDD